MLLTAGWSWLIVLYSLPVTGFLGTGATFEADANLVVQLVMAAALVAGAFLAKQKRYRAHGICQTTVLLLNLWMIGLVMWPTFRRQVNPTFPKALHRSYYAAPMVHAALGMTAELLGLYIVVVASTNIFRRGCASETGSGGCERSLCFG